MKKARSAYRCMGKRATTLDLASIFQGNALADAIQSLMLCFTVCLESRD